MPKNLARPQAVVPVLLVLAAGTAPAQLDLTSVSDGDWFAPMSWDLLAVPAAVDSATLDHALFAGSSVEVASLMIGDAADGSLTLSAPDTDITIAGPTRLGTNGATGTLSTSSFGITTGTLVVGAGGPGVARLDGVSDVTTVPGGGGPATLRVGADGSPGTVVGIPGFFLVRAGGGMHMGPLGAFRQEAGLQFATSLAGFAVTGGDLVFDPGATLDLRFAAVSNSTAIDDRFSAFNYSNGLVGFPQLLAPIGYGAVLDELVPGRVDLLITALPGAFEWATPGPGSFTGDANWAGGVAPTQGGRAFIRNGGSAEWSGNPGASDFAGLNELTVGGVVGAGSLVISSFEEVYIERELNIGSLTEDEAPAMDGFVLTGDARIESVGTLWVRDRINIGEAWARGTAEVSAAGQLFIDDVDEIIIGSDIDVGAPVAIDGTPGTTGSSATGTGFLSISNVGSISIGDDFDIAEGATSNAPGAVVVDQRATVLVENVGSIVIGFDLDLGQSSPDEDDTEIVDGEVTFRNVGEMRIGSDFDYNQRSGTSSTGVLDYRFTCTFEDSHTTVESSMDMLNPINIRGSDLITAIAELNLQRSTLVVEGSRIDIGNTDLGGVPNPGPELTGATGNLIDATVSLDDSLFESRRQTRIGLVLESAPADASRARMRLAGNSVARAGRLVMGPNAVFGFEISGLDPATDPMDGRTDTYTNYAIDHDPALGAEAAVLDGIIEASFEPGFAPPPGTHTFDIVSTTGPITGSPTLRVEGVPAGFDLRSFTVEGTPDGELLRLTISDVPTCNTADIAPPFGVLDLSDIGLFITAFVANDPVADLEPDGVFDLTDISTFTSEFLRGCP